MGNQEFENAISSSITKAFEKAIAEARLFRGLTDPNPTVGAAALDAAGNLLGVAAHERAGTLHAETKLLAQLETAGQLPQVHTLIVTLEPCHHVGRMPPCTASILKSGIKNLFVGSLDPNPKAQGGLDFLSAQGISAKVVSNSQIQKACEKLIAPFKKHILEKRPYITVKKAVRFEGSMIPPPGQKTFTDPDAIRFAHELRKRARGILTGAGTVIADSPLFSVREIPDFKDCPRLIGVMDQKQETPQNWIEDRERAGFKVRVFTEISDALTWFYEAGCLEILVEAGPSLTDSILKSRLWDELFTITQARPGSGQKDQIWGIENDKCSPESSKN